MLKNYFLVALRNILRHKSISLINIIGLSISMSVCLLLIVIVADQFAFDNFHSKKEVIYRVITDRVQQKEYVWSTATTAFPLADILKQQTDIENVGVIFRNFDGVASWNDKEIPFDGLYADNEFFNLFDFPLAKGNRAEALNFPNAIVLTNALSQKLFGTENPLNQVVAIEGRGEFVVTGVFAEFPGNTHLEFEALTTTEFSLSNQQRDSTGMRYSDNWHEIYNTHIYVELKETANAKQLEATINKLAAPYNSDNEELAYTFKLQPLTGITPGPLLSNNSGFGLPNFMIYTMLGIALIVLFSACFNYANLTTARAMNRSKEIGVRKVVGAMRYHIFAQFMIEAMLIAAFSFFFAELMVQFMLPALNNYFLSLGAPIEFKETPNIYWWFLGFVLLAGFVAGVIPALVLSATQPLNALKKNIQLSQLSSKLGFSKFDIRKLLVVGQFTFSIFFVITMITLYQQLNFVLTKDHGFRTQNVINIHLNGLDYDKIKPAVNGLSSVSLVSSASHMPALGTNNSFEVTPEGKSEPLYLSHLGVDYTFIPLMELQLLSGKNFPENQPETEQSIIINEKAIAHLGFQDAADAVGRFVYMDKQPLEILGVVKDFHFERLDEEIHPFAFRYLPEIANHAVLRVAQGNEKQAMAGAEKIWKELTNRPFEATLFADDLRRSYSHFEALLMITGYVSIVVVSLACLGLLGMVLYHVQNKTKEIGIRKTLGATPLNVLTTVGKSFFILLIISYAIGGPLSYFVNNLWLETNVYRIDFGWPTILLGGVVVLLLVALTVGYQMFKAIQINPVDSLKHE